MLNVALDEGLHIPMASTRASFPCSDSHRHILEEILSMGRG